MADTPDKSKTELLIQNAVLTTSIAFGEKLETKLNEQQKNTETLIRQLHKDYSKDFEESIKVAQAAKKSAEDAHARIDKIWVKVFGLTGLVSSLIGFVIFIIDRK